MWIKVYRLRQIIINVELLTCIGLKFSLSEEEEEERNTTC